MRWLPFFGSDDDGTDNDNVEYISSDDEDVTVVSNISDSNIEVVGAESVTTTASGGVTVHKISVDETDPHGEADGRVDPAGGSRTPQEPPSTPDDDGDPSPDPAPRGTLVFPKNKHFMQKLEARGENGHGETVETVYVLAGANYARPTDLIRLDNETYYRSATKTSVRFDPRAMAEKVANLYPSGAAPKMIARFHTHPSGSVRPSTTDKDSAAQVRRAFENAFGTDDFEFFHGIHGLQEHGRDPSPGQRQDPSVSEGSLSWLGERYRHRIAVYGAGFEQRKPIRVE